MSLSPQAKSVVDRLLAGETVRSVSGTISLGPFDRTTKTVLQILMESQLDLDQRKGADQASRLRQIYEAAKESFSAGETGEGIEGDDCATDSNLATPGAKQALTAVAATEWRLWSVTCRSVRGIAPAGEDFSFSFDGHSTLIFGQNGSGKSSLLGAVVWVLAGRVLLDSDEQSDSVPIYRIPGDTGRGTKICDWPVAVTLPTGIEPSESYATCVGELELRSLDGKTLWVRRTSPSILECSSDYQTWSRCSDLAHLGVGPLDIQLSLLAPTVFGQLAVEKAPDTRSLLSLMLGFDDLESLGELASKIAGNRTRLANKERNELATAKQGLVEKLTALCIILPEESLRRKQLDSLCRSKITSTGIADFGKTIAQDVGAAESNLAELLGLGEQDKASLAGLATQLTSVVSELDKGASHVVPKFEQIGLITVFKNGDGGEPSVQLAKASEALEAFFNSAKSRILGRLDWWKKETQSGGRAALLLRAAQDYAPANEACPVCEQSIRHLPLKDELNTLKSASAEWQRSLNDFFRDLSIELDAIVRPSLLPLADSSPSERIKQDWIRLRDEIAGPLLKPITQRFEQRLLTVADSLDPVESRAPDLIPSGSEEHFRNAGAGFVERACTAQKVIAILKWSQSAHAKSSSALSAIICVPSSESNTSLLSALSKGKQAAEEIRPLAAVRDQLRSFYKDCLDQERQERQIALLDELESALDRLKALSKYAADEVGQIFEPVRTATIENLKKLYPECPSGLVPTRLHMGKGKDKSVESLLSSGKCEVPGRFFANASLQRAIALSFFFALVDQHPRGLGFLVMDDPLLSLDEEHRESWSTSILCPCMDKLQIVVATHQRQYLNHNRHHFQAGKVVELNPRVRAGKISWRPGNRLERAALELERAPTNAPNELRKYREELLITLDTYSPQPFLDGNLTDSFRRYRQFSEPHPLASAAQAKILDRLTKPEVTMVLDPGSHAMTEADVTPAMIHKCIEVLKTCDNSFHDELERLEQLRKHTMRRSSIAAACIPFPSLAPEATWAAPIVLQVLGSAAARPDSLTVVPDGDTSASEIPPALAVLVSGQTLVPVARPGQWVLLAQEEGHLQDGDLAAISADNGRRYLRRVWSEGDNWVLQSVNPVTPVASIVLRKMRSAARRIIGVLYEPLTRPGGSSDEWQPRSDFDPTKLLKLRVISVEGDSLDPIARSGQRVLVKEKLTPRDQSIRRGTLAVVETSDEDVGCVIKRVFPADKKWTLISSNPVDPHDPIVIAIERIQAVWPLHGVLFEMSDVNNE
jgi:energy-coupling factor transporter ATP-binding protein EcfA2/SOS-response transcriptional repressor LexA